MLKIFLCLAVLLSPARLDSPSFYVERVEVQTKYDSRYIFERVSAIVPPNKLVRESDIECLISELKASGIFDDIRTKLIQTREDTRRLVLSATYHRQLENFIISDITLDELSEVDKAEFQLALDKKGLKLGIPFLKYRYRELVEKITESLREVYPDSSMRDKMGMPWIIIRPVAGNELRLIVSPAYTGCGVQFKEPQAGTLSPHALSVHHSVPHIKRSSEGRQR